CRWKNIIRPRKRCTHSVEDNRHVSFSGIYVMRKVLTILCLLVTVSSYAQKMEYKGFPSLVWPKLYNISFVKASDDRGEFDKPVFASEVSALANKTIVLPGYMVPLENALKSRTIMLSSLPLNACFFCGVGGPETVAEVHLKTETSYI